MPDSKKVPEIRFGGHEDCWCELLLNDISEKEITKNIGKKFVETFTNSAEYGVISQRDFFDHDITNEKNITNYYIVENDDFVYNPRISTTAPVGPVNRNKLGRSGVMSPLYYIFRTHDIDNTFLEYFFKANYWHKFMLSNGNTGARADRFSIRDDIFVKMPIFCPCFAEQNEIGNCLDVVNEIINRTEQKLAKLQALKKSMLEKMFPKDGALVPEIRFKGFSCDWERKKLGEICTIATGKLDANAASKNGQYAFFTCGKETLRTNSYAFEGEAILISGNGDLGFTRKYCGKFNAYQRTYVLQNFALHTGFCEYAIHKYLPNRIISESFGGAMPYIKLTTLSELVLYLPVMKTEIELIAQYFDRMDALIKFSEEKLAKLQNLKSALLEKMFVG